MNYNTPYLIGQHISIDVDRVSFDAVEGNVDLLPIQNYFFDQVGRDDFSQEFILKSKLLKVMLIYFRFRIISLIKCVVMIFHRSLYLNLKWSWI